MGNVNTLVNYNSYGICVVNTALVALTGAIGGVLFKKFYPSDTEVFGSTQQILVRKIVEKIHECQASKDFWEHTHADDLTFKVVPLSECDGYNQGPEILIPDLERNADEKMVLERSAFFVLRQVYGKMENEKDQIEKLTDEMCNHSEAEFVDNMLKISVDLEKKTLNLISSCVEENFWSQPSLNLEVDSISKKMLAEPWRKTCIN